MVYGMFNRIPNQIGCENLKINPSWQMKKRFPNQIGCENLKIWSRIFSIMAQSTVEDFRLDFMALH